MALLRSGTRIYGNATIDTVLVINGSDAATSNATGALKVAGGIGVVGNIFSSGNIVAGNANLGNIVRSNYFAGTILTASQTNITSLGELVNLTVSGDTVLNGNLVINGTTTTISSNNTTYVDSIIELHTQPNLAPLTVDDGKDIGVRVHYFKSTDKAAFFGFANDSQAFEYYVDGTETAGAISGTYGNFKGATYISTTPTGVSPFVVNSTTLVSNLNSEFSGSANTANTATTAGTVTTNAQPNITSVGILSTLSVSGLKTFGNVGTVKITGGSTGYVLATDGTGNLNWTEQVSNSIVAGTVYTAAQPNITSVGTLTNLSIDGNIIVGNGITTTGNISTQYILGNGYYLTGVAASIGTLPNLTTSGNVNFTGSGNIALGDIANINLAGGTSGQVIQTDGTGNLSFASIPTPALSSTVDEFTGDGIQTAFTLTATPQGKNYTFAVVHGIMQPKSSYSVTGAVLTFSSAPPDASLVEITTMGLS